MRAVVIWLAIILVPISCQAEQAQCNARVLLVGGDTDQFVSTRLSPTAELYNPKTQTFTQLANKPSIYGAAALLPNGRVLIIGQGMAELYRPQHHDFIPAGTPLDARHNAAIGLANGNVLLYEATSSQCFQLSCQPPSNTAEIYDWKTGTFSMVKSSVGLVSVSVLLNKGQVLLAGDDLELYRPHRNDVITAISLPVCQFGTTYVTGAAHFSGNKALLIEGVGAAFLQTQVFNRNTNSLTDPVRVNGPPVEDETVTWLNTQEVLILGGFNLGIGNVPTLGIAALYEPSAEGWLNIDPKNIPCKTACSTESCGPSDCANNRVLDQATILPNGQVLVSGGYVYQPSGASIGAPTAPTTGWLYNPRTRAFTATAGNMTTPRVGHTATLFCQ